MPRDRKKLAIGILFILIFSFLLAGIRAIPFHPDETSILFQSRDFELLLSRPSHLFWDANNSEQEQVYRLLNPPLPKYILGLGRQLAGFGPESVDVDWNWEQTWDENLESGAFPDSRVLSAARTASTIFLFLALIPLALVAKRLGGESLVVLTLIVYGTHALLLLHGRRAMAEGVLIFSISFAIYGLCVARDQPLFAGVTAALAASSKLSAAPLLAVGFIAAIWGISTDQQNRKALIRNMLKYTAAAVIVLFLLNPVLWANPFRVAPEIWTARVAFVNSQIETLEEFSPEHILRNPVQRSAAMIYHLFINPPQTAEVANYIEATEESSATYLSNPLHVLARNLIGGSLYLVFFVSGILFSLVRSKGTLRKMLLLLLLATILELFALLWANPLPFQRYYMPLVPFIILWIAVGLQDVLLKIKQATQKIRWPANRIA